MNSKHLAEISTTVKNMTHFYQTPPSGPLCVLICCVQLEADVVWSSRSLIWNQMEQWTGLRNLTGENIYRQFTERYSALSEISGISVGSVCLALWHSTEWDQIMLTSICGSCCLKSQVTIHNPATETVEDQRQHWNGLWNPGHDITSWEMFY